MRQSDLCTEWNSTNTDVIIIGGGVAGLFCLSRALKAGYDAILFERKQIGGTQTVASQGILHSGVKFALAGRQTSVSRRIAAMPPRWRACFGGEGELDLAPTRILSNEQHLWSGTTFPARLATLLASKAVRSRVVAVRNEERPKVFNDATFRGPLYAVQEQTVDVPSLIAALTQLVGHRLFFLPSDAKVATDTGTGTVTLTLPSAAFRVGAQRLVLTAGEGNQELLQAMGRTQPQMQIRPLHMVMLCRRQQTLPEIFAHCVTTSPKPRVTITTHRSASGNRVWYLGGQIAEDGVARTEAAQIDMARLLLSETLPWVDLHTCDWATLRVNRAEPRQSILRLPDSAFTHEEDRVITAWPTKLVLAPSLADAVLLGISSAGIRHRFSADPELLRRLARPELCPPPWAVLP